MLNRIFFLTTFICYLQTSAQDHSIELKKGNIQYRLDSATGESYSNGSWVKSSVVEYFHYGSDTIFGFDYLSVAANGDRTYIQRHTYAYDGQNSKWSEHLHQSWINQSWRNSERYHRTFQNTMVKTTVRDVWNTTSSAWKPAFIDSFSYDGQNRLLQRLIYNFPQGIANPYKKWDSKYHTSGKVDTIFEYQYPASEWLLTSYYVYYYDAQGNDTLMDRYSVNGSGIGNPYQRTRNTYNQQGDRIHQDLYAYSAGNWIIQRAYDFHVNTLVSIENVLITEDINSVGSYVSLPTQTDHFLVQSGTLNPTSRTICHYDNTLPNGIIPKNESALKVYPNPCSDYLYLEGESQTQVGQVCIFDLQGKLRLQESINPNEGINLTSLPNGMYVVLLLDTEGVPIAAKKILKQ